MRGCEGAWQRKPTNGETPFDATRPFMLRCQRSPRRSERKMPARPVVVRTASRWKRNGIRPLQQRMPRSEEHTSELQSLAYLVCRLLLEKKKNEITSATTSPPIHGCTNRT